MSAVERAPEIEIIAGRAVGVVDELSVSDCVVGYSRFAVDNRRELEQQIGRGVGGSRAYN